MDTKTILIEVADYIDSQAEALKESHSIPSTGIIDCPETLKTYSHEKHLAVKVRQIALDLSPDGYVAVPVAELEKLEQSRRDIFTHLQEHVGSLMLLELTGQIWKIANRKKWD